MPRTHAFRPQPAEAGSSRPDARDDESAAGVLIVRVWLDGPGPEQLRIRMIGRKNVSVPIQDDCAVASIPRALNHIREWLEHFVDEQSPPPGPVTTP